MELEIAYDDIESVQVMAAYVANASTVMTGGGGGVTMYGKYK